VDAELTPRDIKREHTFGQKVKTNWNAQREGFGVVLGITKKQKKAKQEGDVQNMKDAGGCGDKREKVGTTLWSLKKCGNAHAM